MDLKVTFLGTGATAPCKQRGMPATLIQRGGEKYLIDCGEGTQRQLWHAFGGLLDIDGILLTHYHTDHILGLPGLLNSYQLRGRERSLPVYGPVPLKRNLDRFKKLMGPKTYEMLEPHEIPLEQAKPVLRVDDYVWLSQAVPHANGALAYALVEDRRPGKLDVSRARTLGIQPGPEMGKLKAGHAVRGIQPEDVVGPSRPGRKVVISGDTPPNQELELLAHQADLLIHEATYLEADEACTDKTQHSTAKQAAKLGKNAEAKRLALYHISARYPSRAVKKEAWTEFMGALVPGDFDSLDLPFG